MLVVAAVCTAGSQRSLTLVFGMFSWGLVVVKCPQPALTHTFEWCQFSGGSPEVVLSALKDCFRLMFERVGGEELLVVDCLLCGHTA